MTVQEEILQKIKEYETIIIHRHVRPDPDALGSQGGLAELLRNTFPNKKVYHVGGPVDDLGYLSEMQEISDETYQDALVIVTDTADTPRVSDKRFNKGKFLIKIDHHPNEDPYGDLLWVNTAASSCSEMIAEFWQMFREELKMNEEAARLLYAGIVGDTGRFLYPSTTSRTLELSAKLLNFGFDAGKLNRQIEQITRNVAKLSGYIYQNLEIDENGAAKIIISCELMKEFGVTEAEASGIVSLPGAIEDVCAWGIFIQQPEETYRVSLRSKGPIINELAKHHNGGGHPLASGCKAANEEEIKEIYQEIQRLCLEYTK